MQLVKRFIDNKNITYNYGVIFNNFFVLMIDLVRLLRTLRLENRLKQKLLKISYFLVLPTVDAIIIIL